MHFLSNEKAIFFILLYKNILKGKTLLSLNELVQGELQLHSRFIFTEHRRNIGCSIDAIKSNCLYFSKRGVCGKHANLYLVLI